MSKIVISGCAALQTQIQSWKQYFLERDHEILDYPKPADPEQLMECYPEIYRNFMESITRADLLFVMNEDHNGIPGYIGAAAFAELSFGLARRMVDHQKIELILLKMPDPRVHCFDEVLRWRRLGWINFLYEDRNKEIIL